MIPFSRALVYSRLKLLKPNLITGQAANPRLSLYCRHLQPIYTHNCRYSTMHLTGSCSCRAITYELNLSSPDDARTSLCHCPNCKKAFGTNYGLTTKVPLSSFHYTHGTPKTHHADNGITREFCDTCGGYILEYGEQARGQWRYICTGSLDDPDKVPPKGEFFCKYRAEWMPEVPGVFHKQELKE